MPFSDLCWGLRWLWVQGRMSVNAVFFETPFLRGLFFDLVCQSILTPCLQRPARSRRNFQTLPILKARWWCSGLNRLHSSTTTQMLSSCLGLIFMCFSHILAASMFWFFSSITIYVAPVVIESAIPSTSASPQLILGTALPVRIEGQTGNTNGAMDYYSFTNSTLVSGQSVYKHLSTFRLTVKDSGLD